MNDREVVLGANVTLFSKFRLTNFARRTSSGRQFGWDGTPLKRYQRRPKVDSDGSEIRRRMKE